MTFSLIIALTFAAFLNIYSLGHFSNQHRETEKAFRDTQCEFSSIFQNVLDGIMILNEVGICLDVNPAATTILRFPKHGLVGRHFGCLFANKTLFEKTWSSFLRGGHKRGRVEMIAGHGSAVTVQFTAAANYLPGLHVFIMCDASDRVRAEAALRKSEQQIVEQLHAVEASRAEAEALRKSALALSQNLAMDSVLDTLLQCISDLVPFDQATVFFVEDGVELMVAREAPRVVPNRIGLAMNATDNTFLQRTLFEKRALLLSDVATETEWQDVAPLEKIQSWLGIPILAAGRVLGILSLGSKNPGVFTMEHLRLARSLAIPAAVAIQNARTHQRAEIYAAELEARLQELREAQIALEHAERRTISHA